MILLLAFQLAVGSQQGLQQLYERAKHDLEQREYAAAEQDVNSALHADPYFVPALVLKARLSLFAHRPDISKSCLITAVTADPSSEEAQFFLGMFYYLQNDFQLAISPLNIAHSLSPEDPMPPFYLAMTQDALGNASGALDLYQRAEDLSPRKTAQRAAILVAYGRFLYSTGKYKQGIEKEQRAADFDHNSRDAHYEFAKGLDHEGDHLKAAEEGELALTLPDLGTSDAQIHFLLGNAYLKLKKYDLAQEHLAKFHAASQSTRR